MNINKLFEAFADKKYQKHLFVYRPCDPCDDEPGSDMSCRHLHSLAGTHLRNDEHVYYLPANTGGSDYSGDNLTVANCRFLLAEYGESDNVRAVYGAHGTYGIAFNLSADWDEDTAYWLADHFERLEQYPVLDDATLREVTREAQESAWETWLGEHDFPDALVKSIDGIDSITGTAESTPLYDLFWELMRETDSGWINEAGNNMTVDLERLCDASVILASENWKALVKSGAVEYKEIG